ncbi:unnamed protein product [Symbiodinium natans]|uniref:Dienelactone hydrolase domain-containing protein n=1 Tax=Symbiodinium natans TaxID=878477 RepID=A0A812TMG3_9DINO|nr:unnamed protein product [Symbiodinium natans]
MHRMKRAGKWAGAACALATVAELSRTWVSSRRRPSVAMFASAEEAPQPRMAKDKPYADAVMAAWQADPSLQDSASVVLEPFVYEDEVGARRLYGRVVKPAQPNGAGVVIVHTAVGPRDVYLHWRAEVLAAGGYTVLVADLLGDELGRGWEPEWGAAARQPLMDDRSLSRKRMRASVQAMSEVEGVDPQRIGAIGYCFGGRAVLDLARLGPASGVAAVASFHGILDDGVLPPEDMSDKDAPRVLVCHGDADPFVSADGRAAFEQQMRSANARWDMLVFGGVRHGFTNPAQDLNPNPAFGYSPRAAARSWRAMEELFAETLHE